MSELPTQSRVDINLFQSFFLCHILCKLYCMAGQARDINHLPFPHMMDTLLHRTCNHILYRLIGNTYL